MALAAITGRSELNAAELKSPRIGVVTQDFAGPPETGGAEALQHAARSAAKAGASVRELKMPEIVAEAWRIHIIVQQYEAHQAFAWEYGENYDAMPPLLRKRLDDSRHYTAADYDAARNVTLKARAALGEIFKDIDVLLALSAPGDRAEGFGFDWRRPLQPALDADGHALRQRAGLCGGRKLAGRRADDRRLRRRRQGDRSRALHGARAEVTWSYPSAAERVAGNRIWWRAFLSLPPRA